MIESVIICNTGEVLFIVAQILKLIDIFQRLVIYYAGFMLDNGHVTNTVICYRLIPGVVWKILNSDILEFNIVDYVSHEFHFLIGSHYAYETPFLSLRDTIFQ